MNTTLIIGTRVVILALLSYSVGILIEQKTRRVRTPVLVFLTLGIVIDITATALMILGSANSPFSIHGALGYSALIAMLSATILLWKHGLAYGHEAEVPSRLHLYSRFAYLWWVITFVVGGLLVLLRA